LLLIEDVNESMYRIERMLLQLQQAGKLHGVRGIIISVLTCKEAPVSARQWQMMLKDVLTGFRGPIVYGFRFGHMDNPYLLPIGRRAMLNTRRAELRLLPT
jgi:muramoyltetrapeptide carboxypeptidase